jgi:hypothetical protein
MKAVGEWCKADILAGMQGWNIMVLTRGMGMTSEGVEVLLADVRDEINSKKLHVYMPMQVLLGEVYAWGHTKVANKDADGLYMGGNRKRRAA